jgi:hypothetical protein
MAEYYPLLAKAVANLKDSTPETRRAIYERASKALLAQLQKSDPPVPQADIDREKAALASAADRVEAEVRARANPPAPPPRPAAPPPPASKPSPAVAKPVQLTPVGVPPLPPPPLLRPPSPRPPAPRAPGAGASWPPSAPAQGDAPPVRPAAPLERRPEPPRFEAPVLPPEEPRATEVPGPQAVDQAEDDAKTASPKGFFRSFGRSRVGAGESGPVEEAAAAIAAIEPLEREKKPDVMRPAAPVPPRTRTFTRRTGVFAVILLAIIGGLAALGYKFRESAEDFARVTPTPEAIEPPAGKISGRAGDRITVSPTPAPAPTQAPAQSIPPPAASQPSPTVPVAQRAALLVDAPDEPTKVKTYVGTVVWTIGQVSSGLPSLQAKVEIPEAKLTVAIVLTKNTDEALSASNRITVRFTPSPDGPVTGVKQIAAPEMRGEDRPQGDPLGALPAQVTENYFWIALAKDDSIARRNIDLLRDRGWFDIPILLANDKIAKVTVEKGTSGDQLLKQALAAWGQ